MNIHQRFREYKADEVLYIEDFDEIIDIGRRMQLECEPDIEFNELEFRSNLFMLLNDIERTAYNMWIVKHKDRIVGFGVGVSSKYFFSSDRYASLTFWYVTPPYRKSRVAFEIFHTFEHWAKVIGAVRIEVGAAKAVGSSDDVNKMFTKRGFERYGELFYKKVGAF